MAETATRGGLQDLGLGKERLEGTSFDEIPENLGQAFADPVQPGIYRFQFPTFTAASPIWESIDTDKYGKRISAVFEDSLALQIVQSKDKLHDGEEYRYRVSNVPRERTKERILVSDMDLLLRAAGCTTRPTTNADYGKALAQHLSGKALTATQEFSWSCNDRKDIYVDNGAGGTDQVEGKKGCGARYYQRDVEKVEGVFPVRITCSNPECGANIRAYGNLTGFKA